MDIHISVFIIHVILNSLRANCAHVTDNRLLRTNCIFKNSHLLVLLSF